MNKLRLLWSVTCALLITATAIAQPSQPIIPAPVKYERTPGHFQLNKAITIHTGNNTLTIARLLKEGIQSVQNVPNGIVIKEGRGQQGISLIIDSVSISQKEGYRLQITPTAVLIAGHDAAGVFYGVQTLLQLVQQAGNSPLQAATVDDYPRFAYRGMHLDVGRHLFPLSFIRKYIDLLAAYKYNNFHWHLTEDQGWRIEIKKYPRLQSIAAWRKETMIGHKKETPHRFDGKRYGGYYTQDEVKTIVRYAQDRQINVIPEIEMPGHAQAALAAYPNLGCTGGPYAPATFWGVFDDVFCAGNDSTFTFLQNVLDEVLPLFPSAYIHLGGDECPKTRWKACPKCQQRIRQENLGDEHGLQSYFMKRMEKYLHSKGRRLIGWDEILEGGLTPDATVMSWRGTEGGIAAAAQGHDAIMTPEHEVYLDHYQSRYPDEKPGPQGFTPLDEVYHYEPAPTSLQPAVARHIIGVQGGLWSEYLPTVAHAEYMLMPRAIALAEVAWSSPHNKDYPAFLRRLRKQLPELKRKGVNYATNFDEIRDSITSSAAGMPVIHLYSTLPDAEIRYSLNGQPPTATGTLYTTPLEITHTAGLRAQLYVNGKPTQRIYTKDVRIHKAVGKPVTLTNLPNNPYDPGAATLVNGLSGTHRYNDNQWIGYAGKDLIAVIDLGSSQSITQLGTHILNYHWQRMWPPVSLTFLVSENGTDYKEVYTHTSFPLNGINTVAATIPAINARYLKVVGTSKGKVPAGEYGAGGNTWLMIDEIIVD
ncbi:family 20 glycosylhydrolase [Chitinophaga pendula]|uniref:glycoside hydrolase family 20 protein n=1 Tax=Chitinophaga TaxID=79328 RepID=UPI000BB02C70|nr:MULTISPECIES: family 20 glycosylhydrolase [Chitinophaga]ASZ12772.1 beta-hexosaminidase [Chitinophaga sp. MD30]UCJ09607.1 family 20 glycosylhydrolase [Chitinophaga pendula]